MTSATRGLARKTRDGRTLLFSDEFGQMNQYGFNGELCGARYIRPDGTPCKRTKDTHPYSYEPWIIWGAVGEVGDSAVYTDRLYQWDSTKFDALRKKHFANARGPGWSGITREEATAFLREYNGDPELEAVRLVEDCNAATGYPVWVVYYNYGKTFRASLAAQATLREPQYRHSRIFEKIREIEQDTYDKGAFPAALLTISKLREEAVQLSLSIVPLQAAVDKLQLSLKRRMNRLIKKQAQEAVNA